MQKQLTVKTHSAPDQGRVFTRSLRKAAGHRNVIWVTTKEANGHLVWRGECLDVEPWEESEWSWQIKGLFPYSRDEAIEACLMAALEEEKIRGVPVVQSVRDALEAAENSDRGE